MRNPLYNDDFEHYLQKQVNQHRVYPSDQIWRNIQQEIHGYRRWPALTFTAITIISLLVAGTLLIKPETKLKTIEEYTVAKAQANPSQVTKPVEQGYEESIEDRVSTNKLTEKTIAAVKTKLLNNSISTPPTPQVAVNKAVVDDAHLNVISVQNSKTSDAKDKIADIANINAAQLNLLAAKNNRTVDFSVFNSAIPKLDNKQDIELNLPDGHSLMKSDYPVPGKIKLNKPKFNPNRLSFQFYITPSSSFRKLVDDKAARINSAYIPANSSLNFADANQVVRQKPAMGIELGFGVGYSLSDKFTLKTGLQFNIRQYNIEAYNRNYEPTTIGLGNDSYNTISSYGNLGGSSPVTLRNKNYEISIPLGLDYKILNAGNVSWNVAAALQPTYIFDKEPFLLSTDLKSYADGSSIMRKWNLNTSLETYLSIQAGDYRWQIGPQFRYQNLPTYNSKYPIKEHLLDYGIKIGFTRRIN